MKQKINRFLAVTLALCFVLGSSLAVSAEIPYESYTYWSEVSEDRKEVYNRPMYEANFTLNADSLGVENFEKISDICTDRHDNLYILDSTSRVVVLDPSYELIREIGLINGTESYNEASGIYVYKDGTIYISDTEGHRVLHITAAGELIESITVPDSVLIPEDFEFRPTKVVIDDHDYLYVLSDGSFYGALMYSPEKSFLGFYGANKVTSTVSDVINNVLARVFPNNARKGNTAQRLPYCFVDLDIDDEGFIYTCNGYTDNRSLKGQIRRLSPGMGKNIYSSAGVNFVDTDINKTYNNGAVSKQDILDIEIDSNGFVYGLESAFGKVFLYDSKCRILTVFGGGMGFGTQVGNFVNVTALALQQDGSKVLVSDGNTNMITVFEINAFGNKVKELSTLTSKGKYDDVKVGWQEIIEQDSNFQPAYSGLARACLNDGEYKEAMRLAKSGYDRETYAIAFEYVRQDFINRNFAIIFILIIAVVGAFIALIVVSKKKKLVFIRNKNLQFMLSTMIHPSNNFTDLKEKGIGSVGLSIVTVIIFYIVTVLQTLAGGFLFSVYDASSFNSLWVLIRSLGLVVLWIVADWMVCTLLGGKGKLKEIIIVTCYSLWPLIFERCLRLLLTNVLLPSEASFLNILDALAVIYFIIMMVIGLLRIHDFNMSKLIGTSALVILGMAAIIFLLIMIVILFQQFWGFIVTLITELSTI